MEEGKEKKGKKVKEREVRGREMSEIKRKKKKCRIDRRVSCLNRSESRNLQGTTITKGFITEIGCEGET